MQCKVGKLDFSYKSFNENEKWNQIGPVIKKDF